MFKRPSAPEAADNAARMPTMSRLTRLAALVSLVGASSVGAAMSAQAAHASGGTDTDDSLSNKGAVVTMTSGPLGMLVYIGEGIHPVTCLSASAQFTAPKTGFSATLTPVGSQPVQFNDCYQGGVVPFTITTSGTWKINFKDAPNDDTQKEPNSGDSFTLKIPVDGLTLVDAALPTCIVVLNPDLPSKVNLPYDDKGTLSLADSTLIGGTVSENCVTSASGMSLGSGDTFTFSTPIHDKS
jgi:hypothetical protein